MVPDFDDKVVENSDSENFERVYVVEDDSSATRILNSYSLLLNELHLYTCEILDSDKWRMFKRILGKLTRRDRKR